MKRLLLISGLLLLFIPEILRIYFIMPFPGSQKSDTIGIAYWLNNNIIWFRILGLALIIYTVWQIFSHSKTWKKIIVVIPLLLYVVVFYYFNYRFQADKMFYQPKVLSFHGDTTINSNAQKLVIGVVINGEAKAYPIEIIGYHHQVRDMIGNTPVMITYCTVCRTGRVYSPVVNGKLETFRLVGMDHFNAMFEDATTKSWWQQATGVAIAGKLKGYALTEIPSKQMTLASWLHWYPKSTIMQPDTIFNKQYKDLEGYDKGTLKSSLEKRDSLSWHLKSWVIGIVHDGKAKAYDWNELVNRKLIQDTLNKLPLLIVLEKDTTTFHAWNRNVNETVLSFELNPDTEYLTDSNTHSTWNMNGECINGKFKGTQLVPVQAYQEFWHSWKSFHPGTLP